MRVLQACARTGGLRQALHFKLIIRPPKASHHQVHEGTAMHVEESDHQCMSGRKAAHPRLCTLHGSW